MRPGVRKHLAAAALSSVSGTGLSSFAHVAGS